jgi:hypothetical protein
MGTTFFDGNLQHDGRDHGTYPLTCLDAATGIQQPADIRADDNMQCALAFWAVSEIELDLFNELAAARPRVQARAP